MKTLKNDGWQSNHTLRRWGRAMGLTLLIATTSMLKAQTPPPSNGLPYIDVTNFTVSARSSMGFTVTSGARTVKVVHDENANTNLNKPKILNPADGLHGAIKNNGTFDDDAVGFTTALNILNVAGGGYLYIPKGSYTFKSRVNITADNWAVTIQGEPATYTKEGQQIDGGVDIYCDNPDGGFSFSHTERDARMTIRDLTLIASREGVGTALYVTPLNDSQLPVGRTAHGSPGSRFLTAERITMRHSGNSTTNYFKKGLVMGIGWEVASGCYRSLITDCHFKAPAIPSQSKATYGFDISECYDPVLQDCSVVGADIAYHMQMSDRREGQAVRRCTADYCRIGLNFVDTWIDAEQDASLGDEKQPGGVPMLCVRDCTIRARESGAKIQGRRFVQIVNNTFNRFTGSNTTPLTDLELGHVTQGIVENNTFSTSSALRINISVTCGEHATAGKHYANSYDLILGPNTLSDNGHTGDVKSNPLIKVDDRATDDILCY